MQRLDGHLRELSASLALQERAARDELLALALAMAEYLSGRAIEGGSASIEPMLDAILAAHPFPGSETEAMTAMTVYMNGKDLDMLGAASRLHPGVTLKEGAELSRGSLRVEAATGVLDASLEERRARLLELVDRYREQEQTQEQTQEQEQMQEQP
jgi:flagellar biosynthesis/type III secretory pathway protein FliH